MRFLVDECTGPTVAGWLRTKGHDVYSVYDEARGMADDDILQKAVSEDYILITNDKDFGEKVFHARWPHKGVIFLRLNNERAANKIAVLSRLLEKHSANLPGQFVVVAENYVRFARRP